jgi:hypothetical protein
MPATSEGAMNSMVVIEARMPDAARIKLRRIIQTAEAGNYAVDYALRCCVVEYLDYGDYRQLPEELIAYMQRALLRDIGQTIKQAIEVNSIGDAGLEILRRAAV